MWNWKSKITKLYPLFCLFSWQEKIPLSKSALESTWLYHEIGRCYLELGKYSDARDYGEKSLQAAREADDPGWQLHASVLVAQSEGRVVCITQYSMSTRTFYDLKPFRRIMVTSVIPLHWQVYAVSTPWNLTWYREKWGFLGLPLFSYFYSETQRAC